jgi:hypothetical protein
MATLILNARRALQRALHAGRMRTGPLRSLPDFLIIGAQRCGTSSLYNYLVEHPAILPALRKEVHYFDDGYRHGLNWYRAHFSTAAGRSLVQRRHGVARVFEASPYYLLHPHAPRRIRDVLPDVRLIALLRNPIDRAESHYHHEVRRGRERLSFEEALDREPERLDGELERMRADERYVSFNHRRFSYMTRGLYAQQLAAWHEVFPQDRLLVLRSEDLFADPAAVVSQVLRWLDVPGHHGASFRTFNQASDSKMNPATRRRLGALFAPHNQRLEEYLGRRMHWEV